jgi:CheY-like chemotaxis protein
MSWGDAVVSRAIPSSDFMRKLRLLAADDNADDLMLLAEAFRAAGTSLEIIQATDGVQAGDLIVHPDQRFELIVLDYYLPKANAREVLERVRAAGVIIRTPIVVMSAHLDAGERDILRKMGVVLAVEKPLDFSGLCELAHRLLDLAGTTR